MRWNNNRYYKKQNSLYKTIIAAGDWNPPAIIALCEVENRQILEDLCNKSYLTKFRYDIIHEESPDLRGIDVCLIYRKDLLKLIHYEYLIPENVQLFTSRSVLYSEFGIGDDTIHLIVNHWPSKRGGILAGDGMRRRIASMVRDRVDSITGRNQNSKIIITGDLNCSPDDEIIRELMASDLINLSDSLNKRGIGSYRYAGTWEMIDQVIVSDMLKGQITGLLINPASMKIFNPPFLLLDDPNYPGQTPFSTYRGYRYQGVYSDHLPIILDLNVK
jgi:predicted extracellular nuclease